MQNLSTKLHIPYLQPSQSQKHVTVNEAHKRLDALVQMAAVSASVETEPENPADASLYILPPGKVGQNWGGAADYALAYYTDGYWEFIWPRKGFTAYVEDQKKHLIFDGVTWHPMIARYQAENPNLFMNGDFQIRQAALPNTQSYPVDRWFVGGAASGDVAVTYDLNGAGEGFLNLSIQNAKPWQYLSQRIDNLKRFAGKSFTLSFRARSTDGLVIPRILIVQKHGLGGGPDVLQTIGLGTELSQDFTTHSISFQLPEIPVGTIIGEKSHIWVLLYLNSSAGTQLGNIDYAYIKLENGDIATPFLQPDREIELQKCRHYFRQYATEQNVADLAHEMYASPSVIGSQPHAYRAEI